ncbi:hypothetical protein [Staphylococcus xylosus]|uniref:hypothetical protein n=1 Tax=Staphylococcus xylosus TaxID=1288 RepID=UPI001CDC4C0E|nr:hypothetical protein [Staphylococcus xylosus]MCA2501802.1 hypothetical protein [Staphylococcus xylosus]MCE7780575.1 hypothetical protein [Staphylococcus xylosus]
MILFLTILSNLTYNQIVEIISVFITAVGVFISLMSFAYTNWRIKSEEVNKNKKTLKLFDSLTKKDRNNMIYYLSVLNRIEMKYTNYNLNTYEVTLQANNKVIKTNNKRAFIIDNSMEVIFENNVENELNNYLNTIKANLESNHVNLNDNSLGKITDKITDLNDAIELCKELTDIDNVYNAILSEVQLPIENQMHTNSLYGSYNKLKKKLKKLSNNLED